GPRPRAGRLPPRPRGPAAGGTRPALLPRARAAGGARHRPTPAMTRLPRLLAPCIFIAGLSVVGWIGAGYLGTSLLGLAVVLLVALCSLAGAFDLRRHRAGRTAAAPA